jgi:hypothetical protein
MKHSGVGGSGGRHNKIVLPVLRHSEWKLTYEGKLRLGPGMASSVGVPDAVQRRERHKGAPRLMFNFQRRPSPHAKYCMQNWVSLRRR